MIFDNNTPFHIRLLRRSADIIQKIHPSFISIDIATKLDGIYNPIIDYKFYSRYKNNLKKLFFKKISYIHLSNSGKIYISDGKDFFISPTSNKVRLDLINNYNNYCKLSNSKLNSLVDYNLEKDWSGFRDLYRIDYLSHPPQGSNALENVLFKLQSCNIGEKYITSSKVPEIVASINWIKQNNPSYVYRRWEKAYELILNEKWRIGPIHGDLQEGNVLWNCGKPVLIDIGDFSWLAPQIIDELNVLQRRVPRHGKIRWFNILEREICTYDQTCQKYFEVLDVHFFSLKYIDLLFFFLYKSGKSILNNTHYTKQWQRLMFHSTNRIANSNKFVQHFN